MPSPGPSSHPTCQPLTATPWIVTVPCVGLTHV
jgi:hypothetical protein